VEFNKIQHFTQLTDAHCERRRKLTYDNFPQPPKFYDVTKDTYLKDDCIKDRFDLEAFIPYDLFEEHKKVVDDYVEKKGLAPNNLDARKEIADWKKRFKFYLNKRVALEKELDQEFRKELHHFYSVENENKQEELKKLKKLLKKHNEDDTRESTELSTYLTKLFPTKNYTEYAKEETLRLEAYNARRTDDEKIEIKRDRKFVEQIGQLQFFPGKTEIKHRKNGETYTVKEPAYFKGRVFMHGTWITQKHHYNEVWAAQNFHPTFLAFVKSCKGKWLKIPPGDPSDEKAQNIFVARSEMHTVNSRTAPAASPVLHVPLHTLQQRRTILTLMRLPSFWREGLQILRGNHSRNSLVSLTTR
jgi:hypothetical protein